MTANPAATMPIHVQNIARIAASPDRIPSFIGSSRSWIGPGIRVARARCPYKKGRVRRKSTPVRVVFFLCHHRRMQNVVESAPSAPASTVHTDQTIALLTEGYEFGLHRFSDLGTDIFRTRLAGRRVHFIRGADAARFFYEGDRFTRTRALPPTVLHSLQDAGSVQTLSGPAHRARKALFLDALDEGGMTRLVDIFRERWHEAVPAWSRRPSVRLHDAAAEVLTRAVCQWAGVPLAEGEVEDRTTEFLAMIDGAGAFGPRNWRGLMLRHRTERWAQRVLDEVPADSTAAMVLHHRDVDGSTLDRRTAAVELLNLLRPTVAVGRFIVYAALALHQHQHWMERFRGGDDRHLRGFAQETRRCAPFFPVVGGRAARDLQWQGETIPAGAWVILDIFATLRDDRLWEAPLAFRPERHADGSAHADALIAQGAGDYAGGHRCPGEPATVRLLEEAVRLLTRETRYRVPHQDLGVDLRRFPTQPASGFVMTDVSRA